MGMVNPANISANWDRDTTGTALNQIVIPASTLFARANYINLGKLRAVRRLECGHLCRCETARQLRRLNSVDCNSRSGCNRDCCSTTELPLSQFRHFILV